MTTETSGRLRNRLQVELAAIAARLPTRDETLDPGLAGSDFLDVAQSVERQELASLGVSRLANRARRLRLALERVDDGDYGLCTECGEPIPARRLLAVPDATTCVACQARLERDGLLEAAG